MSCKVPLNNSFKANCDPSHWGRVPSMDVNVKFAGEEAKDRLYEPKHQKKVVRVLTVVAYIFFVSLAAIMLSLYYVFIWNGHQKENTRLKTVMVPFSSRCNDGEFQIDLRIPEPIPTVSFNIPVTEINNENSTWYSEFDDFNSDYRILSKRSVFMRKLIGNHETILK